MTTNSDPPAVETSTELATISIAERELAVRQQSLVLIQEEAGLLAQARGIVPSAYIGHPENIIAAALYGRSFGWDTPTSLRYIYVIDGKPSLANEALVAMVHRAGHRLECEHLDTQGCTVIGTRTDTGSTARVTYTMNDAAAAGLAGKRNWKAHPKSMLWARASSMLCKQLFPDVVLGAYSEDELSPGAPKRSTPPDTTHVRPVEAETVATVGEVLTEAERIMDTMPDTDARAFLDMLDAKVEARYGKHYADATTLYSLHDGLGIPSAELARFIEWMQTTSGDAVEAEADEIHIVDVPAGTAAYTDGEEPF